MTSYSLGDRDVRPWGEWEVIASGDGYVCKELRVNPRQALSLQSHNHRSEHWIVLSGIANVTLDRDTIRLAVNGMIFIPRLAKHRIENPGDEVLRIVEVQVGDNLDELDIRRFDDRYGRVG